MVAVTQKTAERSYRELIEQQIQTYQRRSGDIFLSPLAFVSLGAPWEPVLLKQGRHSAETQACLKPKLKYFGFLVIDLTWEGVSV